MRLVIDNKYNIPLVDGLLDEDVLNRRHRPYATLLKRRPSDVGREAWCVEHLLKVWQPGFSDLCVVEYFAGLGMGACIVESLFDVDYHVVNDIDSDCTRQLENLDFESDYEVMCTDSYKLTTVNADLVLLDFNRFTILQLSRNKELQCFLRDIFVLRPDAVMITDSAISKLHLNAKYYSRLMDIPIDAIEDYIKASSRCYCNLYGYSVIHAAYHGAASYMLLTPGINELESIIASPPEAKHWAKVHE